MESNSGTDLPSRVLLAARLGELCAMVGPGPDPMGAFLDAWCDVADAEAAFLEVGTPGGRTLRACRGPGSEEFRSAGLRFLPDGVLAAIAGSSGVSLVRLPAPADASPAPGGWRRQAGSLLAVAADGERGARAVLVAAWPPDDGAGAPLLAEVAGMLAQRLQWAIIRLAEADGRATASATVHAWERSKVPLLFLKEDLQILRANPAAMRKLDIATGARLPAWLLQTVGARIRALETMVLGEGDPTGEHAYLGVSDGHRDYRVGIAPVWEDGDEARWLLSVERGGPSVWERVERAEATFGLTHRESLVLELLARGMSNRQIASAASIKEATVKFHLLSVMRKSGTSSRTELLASFYSDDLSGGHDASGSAFLAERDAEDLGFARLDWGGEDLARLMLKDEVDGTAVEATALFQALRRNGRGRVRLYVDFAGLKSLSPEAAALGLELATGLLRACAIRAGTAVGHALAAFNTREHQAPYPVRVFRSEAEAMAWLAGIE